MWSADSKELYFIDSEWTLVAAALDESGPSPRFTLEKRFPAPLTPDDLGRDVYAPDPRGRRFLFNERVQGAAPLGIDVLLNWSELMRQPAR